MHDASSPSQPFPKNSDETTPGRRTASLALGAVIVHSLLLIAAPFVQTMTTVSGGWIDASLLLVLFTLGPCIGIGLYVYGQERPGSIVLLAFMPAAAYSHISIIMALVPDAAASSDVSFGIILFGLVLVLLALCSLLGSLLSLALLRDVHAAMTAPERNDQP